MVHSLIDIKYTHIENISFHLGIIPLAYDVASGSEIKSCDKIDKPLVVYRFSGNVTTSITILGT